MSNSICDSLKAIGIDLESGKQKFGGNTELYLIFLKKLTESDDLSDLDFHISKGNVTQAVFTASALCAESRNLCADALSDCLADIEEALKAGNIDKTQESALALRNKVNAVKSVLNSL